MPKLQGYICQTCGEGYEFTHHPMDEQNVCPACGSTKADLTLGGTLLTTIIPIYPGCKRLKAGHVHSHGDRPAEKGSVSVPRSFTKETA